MALTVVIGGTRSGKSARAEALATATGLPVRYVATADPADASMRERIRAHKARRPAAWTCVDVGVSLAAACSRAGGECVLVDGLGPWIATLLHAAGAFTDPAVLPAVGAAVLDSVARAQDALASAGAAIVVAEQAGDGVLPPDAAARAWIDLLGDATQRFADRADTVELVVAGRSIPLGRLTPDAGGRRVDAQPVAACDAHAGELAELRRHGDRDVGLGDADHAVNVVAGGPPAWLRPALDAALAGDAGRYPREDRAIAALAVLHGRDPAEVVPTNGAAEALWLLPAALRPTLAACVHPGFTESEAALRAHHVPIVRVPRDPDRDFALDPAAVPDAADLVLVGNPASPSGTLDPAATILALRRPGRTIVVDEAFMDLVPGEPCSLVRERLDDVIVIRSITKALGVPGLRAGYAVAATPLADRLRSVRPPWSANVLALAALEAAAAHTHEIAAIAGRANLDREDLRRRLGLIPGIRVWPGAANFVLVAVADGPAVVAALKADRIAVRPAGSFAGLDARYIRITARDSEANERVAAALAVALAANGRRASQATGQ
ncbi:MAG TPA: bifunctional adenosylcobinamide kinase/adenosylcobinamide-phosphate guanylyltransferase [Solirubrobacteraceae bacterium]|nr:bifunctional adenosylcobinamide kinase/adenosylcobinamide-phosphate guanylyltransferase [Solirubrobacteraceae bacterium]